MIPGHSDTGDRKVGLATACRKINTNIHIAIRRMVFIGVDHIEMTSTEQYHVIINRRLSYQVSNHVIWP